MPLHYLCALFAPGISARLTVMSPRVIYLDLIVISLPADESETTLVEAVSLCMGCQIEMFELAQALSLC